MRSTGGRPAPRSMRVGNISASSFAPVLAAMRAAAMSAGSRRARPPSSSAFLPPACSTRAIAAMASSVLRGGGVMRRRRRGHAAFAPGHVGRQDQRGDLPRRALDAATASAASRHRSSVLCEVRTQGETLRATVSMSDCSCASYWTW